jgi:hypothetical protein
VPKRKKKGRDFVRETITLGMVEGRRGVIRYMKSGVVTLELDIETLRWLGLPVHISGTRKRNNFKISVEAGPEWEQYKSPE